MSTSDKVLQCRLRRAKTATQKAIDGDDKNLWYIACDLWDNFTSHPSISSFKKKLYEASLIRDYNKWTQKR
jgi:hypothetical protein